MNLKEVREYCSQKKCATEKFPFDDRTLTICVGGKMFLLTDVKKDLLKLNLKCYPEMSFDLRRDYAAVEPGFHMNKKHWNTVTVGADLEDDRIKFLIDVSYELVLKGLKKSEIERIKTLSTAIHL